MLFRKEWFSMKDKLNYGEYQKRVKETFEKKYRYSKDDVDKYFKEEETIKIIESAYKSYINGYAHGSIEAVTNCLDMCY